MPRLSWPLQNGEPVIVVQLRDLFGFTFARTLLADTGAGPQHSPFQIVLSEADGTRFGGKRGTDVGLSGAIAGQFPIYPVRIEIPALNFTAFLATVAVPAAQLPAGLDGIAAFRFLNSFTYGNFGDAAQFGLEMA